APGSCLETGLVVTAMAEFEFVRFRSRRKGQQLVAQTDAHDRAVEAHGTLDIPDGRGADAGISRSVRHQHGIEVLGEEVVVGRYPNDGQAPCTEVFNDARLASAVDHNDGTLPARIDDALCNADGRNQVMPVRIIEGHIVCPDYDLAEHAALLPQPLGKRSRVDSRQTGNSFLPEPLREAVAGRRVTVALRQLGNDEPRHLNSSG